MKRFFVLLAAIGAGFCVFASNEACADVQLSSRLAIGGGADLAVSGANTDTRFIFDLGMHADALFGPARPNVFRIGPALHLRFPAFDSAEIAAGATLLLPVFDGLPLLLTSGVGWAARSNLPDGRFAFATVAWGVRAYNYSNAYMQGLGLYLRGQVDLDESRNRQIVAGAEIDLLYLTVIPAIFVWELLTEGDPDEPEGE